MSVRECLLAAALVAGAASVALAQQPEPIPRVVADVRGASAGLPTGLGWVPPVPEGAVIPGRGFGLDGGGHVYIARFKVGAIGVGGTVLIARGESSPPEPDSTTTTTVTPLPAVRTRLMSLLPHVSLNFGHRLGWSYVSGGLGRTLVRSELIAPLAGIPPEPMESPWVRTVHYGGGARWFVNDHVAFSLDLRWYKLSGSEATATEGAFSKQSLITATAGVSFK
jgi:hypothetical protein